MRISGFVYLLVLLALSSSLDDACAAVTLAPADELQAAASSEYLAAPAPGPVVRPLARYDLPPPAQPGPHAGRSLRLAHGGSDLQPPSRSAIALVYLLMSLQR